MRKESKRVDTHTYGSNLIHFFIYPEQDNTINQVCLDKILKTYNLHFSDKIRGYWVLHVEKAETGYDGVTAHEQKGADKGKHTLIRPVVYTNHQLGLWKRARVVLKMQDRVWKHMKVLAKSRMLWVALDSPSLGDKQALWIYWTCWLCLYRVRIMEPLAQKMSTENETSGEHDQSCIYWAWDVLKICGSTVVWISCICHVCAVPFFRNI